MTKNLLKHIKLILVLLFLFSQTAYSQKTDIIILKNGDRITGEIKEMEAAVVRYKTDALKTVYVQWEEVKYLKSTKSFRIEMSNGNEWFGSIESDTLRNQILILVDTTDFRVDIDGIVRIIPIESTFWERLKINADLGFNFTKSSDVAQLNFSGNARLRTWRTLREFTFSSIITSQKDTNSAQNHDFNLSESNFFRNYWFYNYFIGAQQNTQLGVKLRAIIGATGGKDLVRTNENIFGVRAGLQGTREWTNIDKGGKFHLEGLVSLNYSRFRYSSPEVDLSTGVDIYPSITDWGRVRIDVDVKLMWEIIDDLYWSLTFYDHYDNKPQSGSATTNDYGVVFGLGWSY